MCPRVKVHVSGVTTNSTSRHVLSSYRCMNWCSFLHSLNICLPDLNHIRRVTNFIPNYASHAPLHVYLGVSVTSQIILSELNFGWHLPDIWTEILFYFNLMNASLTVKEMTEIVIPVWIYIYILLYFLLCIPADHCKILM